VAEQVSGGLAHDEREQFVEPMSDRSLSAHIQVDAGRSNQRLRVRQLSGEGDTPLP
jgi:hypothetical protein